MTFTGFTRMIVLCAFATGLAVAQTSAVEIPTPAQRRQSLDAKLSLKVILAITQTKTEPLIVREAGSFSTEVRADVSAVLAARGWNVACRKGNYGEEWVLTAKVAPHAGPSQAANAATDRTPIPTPQYRHDLLTDEVMTNVVDQMNTSRSSTVRVTGLGLYPSDVITDAVAQLRAKGWTVEFKGYASDRVWVLDQRQK